MSMRFEENPAYRKPLNDYDLPFLLGLGRHIESCLLEAETLRLGFESLRFTPNAFYAFHSGVQASLAFHGTRSNMTSYGARLSCRYKHWTRLLLERARLRVPPGAVFAKGQKASALAYSRQIGWPIVVKPVVGSGGAGVVTNIRTEEELHGAMRLISQAENFLVEKHVTGFDYRFQVLANQVVAVHWRQPAHVICDGASTIEQLIEAKNSLRRRNPHLATRPIEIDSDADAHLKDAGYTPDDIPAEGSIVSLRTVGNLSKGGDNVDVTAETHPSLKDAAVAAVAAIPGLEHAGVDILLANHEQDVHSQEVNIIEVNACPGMSAHHFPVAGKPQAVARSTVRHHASLQAAAAEDLDSVNVRLLMEGVFDPGKEVDRLLSLVKLTSLEADLYEVGGKAVLGALRGDPLQVAAVTISACQTLTGRMTQMRVQHI